MGLLSVMRPRRVSTSSLFLPKNFSESVRARSRWFQVFGIKSAVGCSTSGEYLPRTSHISCVHLFIGLVIGAQVFQASPSRHAPAVVLAIIPNIAAWGQTQVNGALAAAGTSAHDLGMANWIVPVSSIMAWNWSVVVRCLAVSSSVPLARSSSIVVSDGLGSMPLRVRCFRISVSFMERSWSGARHRRWRSVT